ncbi:GntR family transcriptional regulator [Mangrovibacillus cuniculi]|uniref:GntR family transcriptional regulator n=1 Tax=Mangrovibacillus cuniculi TaxID=2593652 RepID=A0A7S8CBM0_9BACI|nr:GntR family transcriptional regulator [Mangrovibacillus cuniculi]QPC47005.1 GntR family transcriptional regulator [Mangrovibacillus cuniculi]
MTEQFTSEKPIYLQIVDKIVTEIVRGERKLGDKLPSVRELAVSMGVNPNTIQRTYAELERMSVVESKRGQGTFVVEDASNIEELRGSIVRQEITNFIERMNQLGISPQDLIQQVNQHVKGEE